MKNDPLTQFELLLEAGKLEEAKEMLGVIAVHELSPREKGEAKALLTRLYIRLSNAISEAYLETLKEAIVRLKEVDEREKAFIEKIKLAETRAGLVK